jgi:hypothetical protein
MQIRAALAVCFLFVLVSVPVHLTGQPLMYAFLLTIDDGDRRNDVIATIRGAGSLLELVEGRDVEPTDPTVFNRYVLKPSLLPVGTPETPALAFVGINAGVPAVVRNEYSQNTIFWRTVEFRGYTPTATRQFMQDQLERFASEAGASHIWHIVPGDSLGGNLLSHFVPVN